MSDTPDGQVVIASRDGVLVKNLEELLQLEGVKPTKIPDQLDLVQLFVGILASSHGRVLLILDGELGTGSTGKRRQDMENTTVGVWEAESLIEQHTSAYESASHAERNAELVLHILTLFEEGQVVPYISVSDEEKAQLTGGDFDDKITFVSESEQEDPEYWVALIHDFLHPKKSEAL